jgi:hypothetical protein
MFKVQGMETNCIRKMTIKATVKFKIMREKGVTDNCGFYCVPEHSSFITWNICVSAKKSQVSCHAWGHNKRGTLGYNGSLLCVYYVNGRSLVGAPACQK